MEHISKAAAVRQMSVYLSYLANRVPLDRPAVKVAAMGKIAQLAAALNASGDLSQAIRETYPDKSAAAQVKLAMKLVRGLSQKRAAAIKQALAGVGQGQSNHPSASLGGASNGAATPQSSNIKVAGDAAARRACPPSRR